MSVRKRPWGGLGVAQWSALRLMDAGWPDALWSCAEVGCSRQSMRSLVERGLVECNSAGYYQITIAGSDLVELSREGGRDDV